MYDIEFPLITVEDRFNVLVPETRRMELDGLLTLISKLDEEQIMELEHDLQAVIDIWNRFIGIESEE